MKKALTTVVVAVLAFVAVLGGGVGAGTAEARWQTTPIYYNILGMDTPAAGKGCSGGLTFGLSHNRAKRGVIRVTVRSRGFTKDNCRVQLKLSWWSSGALHSPVRYFPLRGTKKRGKILFRKEIWFGSGLAMVSMQSTGTIQKPGGGYIVVP